MRPAVQEDVGRRRSSGPAANYITLLLQTSPEPLENLGRQRSNYMLLRQACTEPQENLTIPECPLSGAKKSNSYMGGQGPIVQGSLRTCANSGTLVAQSKLKAKNKSRHEVPIEARKRVVLQKISKTKPDGDAIVCDMCWGKAAPHVAAPHVLSSLSEPGQQHPRQLQPQHHSSIRAPSASTPPPLLRQP